MKNSLTIIGGGIIGLCSARYLSRAGWNVTVMDRQRIGGGCSRANCGLICPSHVLPLAEPGALRGAFRAMFSPASPLRIRPRLDPALWNWLWNFAKRCNQTAMLRSARAIQPLLENAMREYREMLASQEIVCEWQSRGLLFAYRSPRELDRYDATNALLASEFNEPAQKLDARDSVKLEAALRDDIAGSWYYEHDAHLRPEELVASLKRGLQAIGVRFVEQCELQEISGQARRAKTIATTQGQFEADQILFACGAWTPLLNELLRCKVPLQPGKGYSLTMPRPRVCPSIPIILPEQRIAVTPMDSAYRLGSIMEFVGYDESIGEQRLDLLRDGAKHYLREPLAAPEVDKWFGWRPMTYDSVPIIDRSPGWDNVWLATGHNMLGMSMGPATGRLVSELISESPPHIDPTPYRLARFK